MKLLCSLISALFLAVLFGNTLNEQLAIGSVLFVLGLLVKLPKGVAAVVYGPMTTGDNVITTFTRNYVDQFLMIGSVDTNNVVKRISIQVGGVVRQLLTGAPIIGAMMKYMMEFLGGADVKVGLLFKMANGFIPDQNVIIDLTNSGANTPVVYGFSTNRRNGVPVVSGMEQVIVDSSLEWDNTDPSRSFTALFFESTNLDYAQVEFVDGYSVPLNALELNAIFAIENQTDADGQLNAVTVIDNQLGNIKKITLWAVTGNLSVARLKLY
jgi:hypothetical protein